jgi:uncharacterized protein (TIGR03435 family)
MQGTGGVCLHHIPTESLTPHWIHTKYLVLNMARLISIAHLTMCLSLVALAQQPVKPMAFEVATIKVNATGPGPSFGMMLLPGGRVFAQNVPLRDLIRAAYALEDSQLEGISSAMRSTRFDLEARIGGDATVDMARAMTRTLLAERFRLAVHPEARPLAVYELVTAPGNRAARGDRALGRGLRPSAKECAPVTLPAGIPPAPPPPGGAGMPLAPGAFPCPSGLLPGHLSLRGVDMTAFASLLWRRLLQRPVFNRTGFSGPFDIDLTYLPELENINGRPASENPLLPPQILGAPSIFTALQEQLGLKLESARGPVDVLVVDRAEPLIEN